MERSTRRRITFFALFAGLLLLSATGFAEKVRYVIDGDTFILETEQKVRMIGIDTPEIDNPRYQRLGEYFGPEAHRYLKKRIEGKEVRLEGGSEEFDKYGRRLAYVYLDDVLINEEMVREGYAEAIRYFDYDLKQKFLSLEARAKERELGMWNRQASQNQKRSPYFGWVGWFIVLSIFAPLVWLLVRRR